jgi:hypothetical protein
MELRIYGPRGRLKRVVRISERFRKGDGGVASVQEAPASGSRVPASTTAGAIQPNYKRFKLGADGRYWFLTQVDGVTEGSWVAVSPGGHPIGTLTLPKRSGEFRILQFFGDTALVAQEGTDGQRQLAEYQIRWSN